MRRRPVVSSGIRSIGYDERLRRLEVEFYDEWETTVYQYFDVPPNEHRDLMAATSHGRYLNTRIKPRYRYVRVT